MSEDDCVTFCWTYLFCSLDVRKVLRKLHYTGNVSFNSLGLCKLKFKSSME